MSTEEPISDTENPYVDIDTDNDSDSDIADIKDDKSSDLQSYLIFHQILQNLLL